jgi:hypothetical protein
LSSNERVGSIDGILDHIFSFIDKDYSRIIVAKKYAAVEEEEDLYSPRSGISSKSLFFVQMCVVKQKTL